MTDIYDHSKPVKKSSAAHTIGRKLGGHSIIFMTDKEVHRNRRKLLSPGFSPEALAQFEPVMVGHIRTFCDQLLKGDSDGRDGWTETKNVKEWCSWLTFDVAGDFVFGQQFHLLTDPKSRIIINAVLTSGIRNGIYKESPALAKFQFWPPSDIQTLRKVFGGLLKDRERASNGLISKVLNLKDSETGQGLPYNEILAECRTMLIAASDTTATSLAANLFYLARCPPAYSQLAHEIRTTFSTIEEVVSGPKLNSCRYLSACVQETLRMSPAAPGPLWREVEPCGAHVDGTFIPGGYGVAVSPYSIHHNESHFVDSFDFRPERWLGGQEEEAKRAYVPFLLGPRSCIGRAFALLEIGVALARVMWLMDFRLSEQEGACLGDERRNGAGWKKGGGEYRIYSSITSYSEGPLLEFRKRG